MKVQYRSKYSKPKDIFYFNIVGPEDLVKILAGNGADTNAKYKDLKGNMAETKCCKSIAQKTLTSKDSEVKRTDFEDDLQIGLVSAKCKITKKGAFAERQFLILEKYSIMIHEQLCQTVF